MSSSSKITTGKCFSNFNETPPSHCADFMPPSSRANNMLDPWLDCLLIGPVIVLHFFLLDFFCLVTWRCISKHSSARTKRWNFLLVGGEFIIKTCSINMKHFYLGLGSFYDLILIFLSLPLEA